MKTYIFKEVKKLKMQRRCKRCGTHMIVDNANRLYCESCKT